MFEIVDPVYIIRLAIRDMIEKKLNSENVSLNERAKWCLVTWHPVVRQSYEVMKQESSQQDWDEQFESQMNGRVGVRVKRHS